MTVVRVQHIGIAVSNFEQAGRALAERFGLRWRDFRNDQGKGMQHDARILLGNDCWLHLVHNWNPQSRVYRFLQSNGEGLEHIALQTASIEDDVLRLRALGIPIFEDTIFKANDGYEAFVYPDDAAGFTVELIQPHAGSWQYPEDARGIPVSSKLGFIRLHHIGAVVRDARQAAERFEQLFGLKEIGMRSDSSGGRREAHIAIGGQCRLHFIESRDPASKESRFLEARGEGLEHLGLESVTLTRDDEGLQISGIPKVGERAYDTGLGFPLELVESEP